MGKRIGPLPVWGWGIAVGGGLLAWHFVKGTAAPGSSAVDTSPGNGSGVDVGSGSGTGGTAGPAGPAGPVGAAGPAGTAGTVGPAGPAGRNASRRTIRATIKRMVKKSALKPRRRVGSGAASPLASTLTPSTLRHTAAPNNSAPTLTTRNVSSITLAPPSVAAGGANAQRTLSRPMTPTPGAALLPKVPAATNSRVYGRPSHHIAQPTQPIRPAPQPVRKPATKSAVRA